MGGLSCFYKKSFVGQGLMDFHEISSIIRGINIFGIDLVKIALINCDPNRVCNQNIEKGPKLLVVSIVNRVTSDNCIP